MVDVNQAWTAPARFHRARGGLPVGGRQLRMAFLASKAMRDVRPGDRATAGCWRTWAQRRGRRSNVRIAAGDAHAR